MARRTCPSPAIGPAHLRLNPPYQVRHIQRTVGAVELAELMLAMMQRMVDDLHTGDKPLSSRIASYVHTVLRIALQEAERLGLLPTNRVDCTRGPRQEPRQVSTFPLEHSTAIL